MRQELVCELDTAIGIAEAELECAMDMKGLGARTKEIYLYNIRKLLEFSHKEPKAITLADAKRYLLYLHSREEENLSDAIRSIRFLFTDFLGKQSFSSFCC